MQYKRVVELELICWELPFYGGMGSFCSQKRFHVRPIRPKDPTSAFMSFSSNTFRRVMSWRGDSLHVKQRTHSWVFKLSRSYKRNLMTAVLFWGTFLKLLWLCLCWVIPIFLCCVWANSLHSLHELNTLLYPTAHDCYLNTTNLDAHHFHFRVLIVSISAFGDLWETFLLLLMFHSLPSEDAGWYLVFFSSCHSSSERAGKFSIKSHLRIFFCLP